MLHLGSRSRNTYSLEVNPFNTVLLNLKLNELSTLPEVDLKTDPEKMPKIYFQGSVPEFTFSLLADPDPFYPQVSVVLFLSTILFFIILTLLPTQPISSFFAFLPFHDFLNLFSLIFDYTFVISLLF